MSRIATYKEVSALVESLVTNRVSLNREWDVLDCQEHVC